TGKDPISNSPIFSAARCKVSRGSTISTRALTNSLSFIKHLLNLIFLKTSSAIGAQSPASLIVTMVALLKRNLEQFLTALLCAGSTDGRLNLFFLLRRGDYSRSPELLYT